MSEQRRFGESDQGPLKEDDILAQAIGQWRDELPTRDLWPGVEAEVRLHRQPIVATRRSFSFTITQLAVAASLLIAVASGLTWMVARPPAAVDSKQPVIQAYGVPD